MDKKTYGERVRAAREQAGLSQSELGRQIGMSPQGIQYLEDPDKAAQGSHKTAKIADVCGVRPLWLESGEGSMIEADAPPRPANPAMLAKAIRGMRPELQRAFSEIVSAIGPVGEVAGGRIYALSPGAAAPQPIVRERTGPKRSSRK